MCLLLCRLLKVLFRLKGNLVVQQQDVLAFEPLPNLLFRLAVVMAFTHLVFDSELLRCNRVVITPDNQALLAHTFKLLLVQVYMGQACLLNRIHE